MRRVTILSDVVVLLGILAVLLGHFRYTRRIFPPNSKPKPLTERRRVTLPMAATAALFAGTALLTSARKAP